MQSLKVDNIRNELLNFSLIYFKLLYIRYKLLYKDEGERSVAK
jgi:hypothetical protein